MREKVFFIVPARPGWEHPGIPDIARSAALAGEGAVVAWESLLTIYGAVVLGAGAGAVVLGEGAVVLGAGAVVLGLCRVEFRYYGGMRIFIPTMIGELESRSISARVVHALTPALAALFDGEETEFLEAVAMNAAADDSLRLLEAAVGEHRLVVPRRCVIAAEVSASDVEKADGDVLPTALMLRHAVGWDRVESIHVDDGEVEQDVIAASRGDEAAFERAAEEDLMWYDVAERDDLYRELSGDTV